MNNSQNVSTSMNSSDVKRWYDNDDTYYQILLVSPYQNQNSQIKGKKIETKIVVKTRRDFHQYRLDEQTQKKLEDYYPDQRDTQKDTIFTLCWSNFPRKVYKHPVSKSVCTKFCCCA